MTSYSIGKTESWHVPEMASRLRQEEQEEALALGMTCKRAIWRSYRAAIYTRTLFVDGEIAAMFGMGGIVLSNEGWPWLSTTAAIEKIPLAFIKEGRKEVQHMLRLKPILVNYAGATHTRTLRALRLMGFTVDEPAPQGPAGALFCRFHLTAEG